MDDYELAKKLQEAEYKDGGSRKNHSYQSPKKENIPASLIDPEWEVIDPNPNIYSLFQTFDRKYFWNTLGAVEVKWSPRMYSCAGICTYKGRGGCVVSLSLPLLKLRPRKDLIETLLHEMIHAYLFLTKNDRDRDGHGPQFHHHMYRINAEAGTRITVYHSFHDEVRHYKTHWWRCDGPCRFKQPFFGIVKRAMNRAPGRTDWWFAQHQSSCGGTFVKIQEPEGFKSRKKKMNPSPKTGGDLRKFFPTLKPSQTSPNDAPFNRGAIPKKALDFTPKQESSKIPSKNINGFKTLSKPNSSVTNVAGSNIHGFGGASANINGHKTISKPNSTVVNVTGSNIHGFGGASASSFGGLKSNKGGTLLENPKAAIKKEDPSADNAVNGASPVLQPFSGTGHQLGSLGTVVPDRSKSRLLSLYSAVPAKKPKMESPVDPLVPCPVCNEPVKKDRINEHLDSCVQMDFNEEPIDVNKLPPSPEKSLFDLCPLCNKSVYKSKIKEHLQDCHQSDGIVDLTKNASHSSSPSSVFANSNPPSPLKHLFTNCPVCDKNVYKTKLDEHLDSCVRLDSIMDSSGCEIVDLEDCEESVGCEEGRCPCCDKTFPLEMINNHLDSCLQRLDFD